jgi:hypothetical protein
MFRIDVERGTQTTSLIIAGSLKGQWVRELELCWQSEDARSGDREIELRLQSVSFVDTAGRDLLVRMRRRGVRLVPSGCFMSAVVAGIEAEVIKDQP